ncbi:MAG: hypothetical protein ACI31D_05365 [Candidatus Limisoma sp.]
MKKVVFFAGLLLLCASCKTVHKTSTTRQISAPIEAAVTADLDVQKTKISYTYYPTKSVRRGGEKNVKAAAVAEALRMNGNADVLVESQEEVYVRTGLTGKKIKSVTVTGYPATYKNFKSVDEETLKKVMIGKCCK